MNVKRNLILLFFSAIILSCNPDEESLVNPGSIQQVEYSFVKMEFIASEQGDKLEQSVTSPRIEYSNATNVAQTFSYDPLNGIYETSQFSGIDTSVIHHIIDSPIIAVPINTDNVITLGEAKWPISNNSEKQISHRSLESSFTIHAHNKMTLETILHYMKIATNIRLTLIDNKENKEHVFEGKWVGVYPISAEIKTIFTEL